MEGHADLGRQAWAPFDVFAALQDNYEGSQRRGSSE
jgi:hypothetical protein